jgi:ATP-dependent Lon protease
MFAEFDGDINKIFEMGKEDDMPILITRNMVNFAGVLTSVTIARNATRQIIKYLERNKDQRFAMFSQRDVSIEEPTS